VKAHHPDKGGDRAKFEQVQRAYDVLMDAERRAKYDATGDDGDKPLEDSIDVMALGLIGQLLMSIVSQDGNAAVRNDCVEVMRGALADQRREHEGNLAKAGICGANVVRLRSRFVRKDGEGEGNRLQAMLTAQLVAIEAGKQQLRGAIEACDRATAILADYRFNVDDLGGWSTVTNSTYLGMRPGRFP
jgi:DnaJ-class molecular chaperone